MLCTRVGTPLYLSPELVKQQPYDYKVDIWAAGCVLYHMACMEPPFAGENLIVLGNNIVNGKPKMLPAVFSTLLHRFIDKLMTKKASERPSAREMVKLLPAFLKKDPGTGEAANTDEIATASSSDGTNQKPQVHNVQAPRIRQPIQPYRSPAQQRAASESESKLNVVRIVNSGIKQEIFQAELRNLIREKYRIERGDKPVHKEGELLPNNDMLVVINNVKDLNAAESEPKFKKDVLLAVNQHDPLDPLHKETARGAKEEEPDTPLLEKSKPSPSVNSQSRPLIVYQNLLRPETASQRQRPTITLLRSINVGFIPATEHIGSSRPFSAGLGNPRIVKRALVDEANGKKQNEKSALGSNYRPHSAMPQNKAGMLPCIEKRYVPLSLLI